MVLEVFMKNSPDTKIQTLDERDTKRPKDTPRTYEEIMEKIEPMLLDSNLPVNVDFLLEEDLKIIATKGYEKGNSVLWGLALVVCDKKRPDIFIAVWRKYAHAIKLEDLMVWVNGELFTATSALTLLFIAAKEQKEKNDPKNLLEEIFARLPGIFEDENALHFIPKNNMLHRPEDIEWGAKLLKLIETRNAFFKELQKVKSTAHGDNFEKINILAQDAFNAGYHNTFYDLAQCLQKNNAQEEKIAAVYALVPQKTQHYMQANLYLEQMHFAHATNPEISFYQRNVFLGKALQYALKLPDAQRDQSIQKIACMYISNPNEIGLQNPYPVSENLLCVMHEETPVEWCFKIFDDIKKSQQEVAILNHKCNEQAARIQQLERELQKVKQTQEDKLDDILKKLSQVVITPAPGPLLFSTNTQQKVDDASSLSHGGLQQKSKW